MKNLLIAASLVGVAVAGVIIYLGNRYSPVSGRKKSIGLGNRSDGVERSMKYTMG
jgi:hypothetical protein